MKGIKLGLIKYACGFILLGMAAKATAQSTWNYVLTDAGNGNALLTWTVTGDLASPSGAGYLNNRFNGNRLPILIDVPNLFADYYSANQVEQTIPTPDGSFFRLDLGDVYAPIALYYANNSPAGGNDSFGLLAPTPLPPRFFPGHQFSYSPAIQSVLLPIDFSNFNPGTYQSQESGFNAPLTVDLTVMPVPEPSVLALSVLGGLLIVRCRAIV